MKRFTNIIKKIFKISQKPEMLILPGQLAFSLVLSIIPIITLVVFGASLFNLSLDSLINIIQESVPEKVSDLLIPFMKGKGLDLNVWVFMAVGFFTASNGAHSIVISSNTLYDIEHSNYLTRKVKSLFLIVLLVFLFVFTLLVLAFGNYILKFILSFGFISNIGDEIYKLFILLKWPFAFFIIFFFIKVIYTIAPDKNIPSKCVNKGALFTTIGWMGTTALYSSYISKFGRYDIFYGSLSNIIILMLWIYLLSYIFTIGIAINSSSKPIKKIIENSN